ncbi:cation:proton antiporter [Ruegeria sp. HKCCD7303]|uniref:cation:proton antiporter n=1 Tax=Ruegeria sp. HKCCD7303 TaxID=2683013 RepID=UPI0014908B5D|nr:cation:proton antiporter [Ruegeria sp. HKCCD7303]NOD70056.1 cyclic nucleotide-binding domain-containing protein [Ruegeria sp. HKCCD7303]
MDIVLVTTVVASLFVVIGLAEPVAARLQIPYSVVLAVLGIIIGVAATFFLQTDLTEVMNPVAEAILGFPIRANVFLYIFLPTLLFQATLGMNLRRMLDDWVPILVLAIVAVFVATFTVGFALAAVSSLPTVACLLLGAIISTTDPSAVVSIFRSIAAPQRLARIIEGESLLNDAAAIALFGLFIGFVMVGAPDPRPQDALVQFPLLLVGGAVTGWVLARSSLWLMNLIEGFELAQISISIALPYLTYVIAEQSVGASGVIAVVVSGITLNLSAPGRLTPQAWTSLTDVWDVLAHWAGALIFILAALLIPKLLSGVQWTDFVLILVVIVAAVAARVFILFGFLPFLSLVRVSPLVERPFRYAILWGGMRGAVTLALALAVTENNQVAAETQRAVGILATGFTLFTLIVQGPTLRPFIRRLGLDKLSSVDEALSRQVVAVSLQTVREDVEKTTASYELNPEIIRSEAVQFGQRLETEVRSAEERKDILDRDRVTLGLLALAGAERNFVLSHMRDRSLSIRLAEKALLDIDRLIEATRSQGRTGYLRAARRTVDYGRLFRIAAFLNNKLRLQTPLARVTAHRFEVLLAQRLVLRDVYRFLERRIRRIHGRRVTDILRELVDRRAEYVDTALDGLQLQYPGFAEEVQRRFIRRIALRLEEREYTEMFDEGLIGAELYSVLLNDVSAKRAKEEERPRIDIAPRATELVKQLPVFSDVDPARLRKLVRALKTRYVEAGEVVIQKNAPARSVYFIASGAVELEMGGQSWRLGRGEIFGQAELLLRQKRRASVQAIVPTTLLVLDEEKFRRLVKRSKALREAVLSSAANQGVELEKLLEPK